MLDKFTSEVLIILSTTIGGVAISTWIGLAIWFIKQARKNRAEARLTKTIIEEAFKNAVFPKKYALDLSDKVKQPLQDGLAKIERKMDEKLKDQATANYLILKILSKFTYANQLTDAEKEAVEMILQKGEVCEIKVEG